MVHAAGALDPLMLPLMVTRWYVKSLIIVPFGTDRGINSLKFSLINTCAKAAAGRAHSVTTPSISDLFGGLYGHRGRVGSRTNQQN
jgi:hypothetical protein